MQTDLQAAEVRITALGFEFIDTGCFERSDGLALRLGCVATGLIIQPLDSASMEPTQPNFLCETDQELDQALLLLGAIAA
jgi:hypothetical protein